MQQRNSWSLRTRLGHAERLGLVERAGLPGRCTGATALAALLGTILAAIVTGCASPRFDAPVDPSDAAGEVRDVLRQFHEHAATANFDAYFGLLAEEGVFIGTDATERWPTPTFREWARPHFADDSAWIFEPRQQNVDVSRDGRFAWFDEELHSENYGQCRGSGVVVRADGGWRILQYHLTVPVPNELLPGVVAQIRGEAPDDTLVVVVRHAEKEGGPDPALTLLGDRRAHALARMLADVPIEAAYATQYRRTQSTIAPTVAQHQLTPIVVDARATEDLAARIRRDHRGRAVLCAGHSNTVPNLIRALGVETDLALTEADYDNVFLVTISAHGPARLLRLHLPLEPPRDD